MTKQETFHDLGIAAALLRRLDKLGFVNPTPIQSKAIPVAITGEDVVGIAQTGTGKTLAFSIPLIQRISKLKKRALVICPTRELALQVEETLEKTGGALGMKTVVLIGGTNANPQKRELKKKPHVVVATPGRLIDHLEQKNVNLSEMAVLVLDEADRMLDMGFEPQLRKIMSYMPKQRQTMLFSATMPPKISKMAEKYMHKPLRVEVAPAGSTTDQVDQELFFVPKKEKMALLNKLLSDYKGTVLVFSRTKHGAKKITRVLNGIGHRAAEIHSNRSQNQRRLALEGFKSGKFRVLVATDIAARGIDVSEIELVVNFDLPDCSDDYVHRIGRTGRASHTGKAISFACPEQTKDVKAIERLIKMQLPVSDLPKLPKTPSLNSKVAKGKGGGGGPRGGRGPRGPRTSKAPKAKSKAAAVPAKPKKRSFWKRFKRKD